MSIPVLLRRLEWHSGQSPAKRFKSAPLTRQDLAGSAQTSVASHAVCTLSKAALVVIPAKAESRSLRIPWIPARASYRKLGRNDVQ